jgi:nicotinate phosphoribosyltransferase
MEGGRRLPAGACDLAASRTRAQDEIARLPERIQALAPATPPYPVEVSPALERDLADASRRFGGDPHR